MFSRQSVRNSNFLTSSCFVTKLPDQTNYNLVGVKGFFYIDLTYAYDKIQVFTHKNLGICLDQIILLKIVRMYFAEVGQEDQFN